MQACIQVCPKNPANFNVDNVRVAKLLGGGLHDSTIVRGMVLKSDAIGSIKRIEKAKVNALCLKSVFFFSLLIKLMLSFSAIFSFYIQPQTSVCGVYLFLLLYQVVSVGIL